LLAKAVLYFSNSRWQLNLFLKTIILTTGFYLLNFIVIEAASISTTGT
jgi:hypothetical protein